MVNPLDRIEQQFPDWRYDHPRILYSLMRSLKPRIAVESGTYRGYAACYMAQACKENGVGHVYCIDDFSEGMQKKYDADHWRANLAACELTDWATLIVGKSSDVTWPETVDFAYIDGWHGLKAIRQDWENCNLRGAECICLDDITSTVGPSYFIQELRRSQYWDVLELHRDCGLAVCMRRKAKPPVSFSQELPNNPGVVLTGMTVEEKRRHLQDATRETGIDYSDYEVS